MKVKVQSSMFKKVLVVLSTAMLMAITASAVGWYQNMNPKLGSISVVELADWLIRGHADYTVIYVAPKVAKIKKIDGLVCLTEDGALLQEIYKLPVYKKWVVITQDGKLSEETSKLLAQSKANTILVLEGGKKAWESKVLAKSVAGLSLSSVELKALNNIRPYFNETASQETVTAPVVRAVSISNTTTPAEEEDEEEEEGC